MPRFGLQIMKLTNKVLEYGKRTRIEGYERGWKADSCR